MMKKIPRPNRAEKRCAMEQEKALRIKLVETFNDRAGRLKTAMDEISGSISSISGAIDGAVSGVTGAAESTRGLVDDMAGITAGMDTNQEIVG